MLMELKLGQDLFYEEGKGERKEGEEKGGRETKEYTTIVYISLLVDREISKTI